MGLFDVLNTPSKLTDVECVVVLSNKACYARTLHGRGLKLDASPTTLFEREPALSLVHNRKY